ncbi:MAG: ABC transporter permease [Thermoleophilia bacterium]
MSKAVWTVFLKELRDVLQSRYFLVLCIALTVVVTLSLVISSLDFHAQLADYQQYLKALQQNGGTPQQAAPQLSPLQQLRGSVEYLEIIGAILAIVIGYGIIAKEKYRGTLRLLFSRPIGLLDVAAGKIAALGTVWLIVLAVLTLVIVATLRLVGGAVLSFSDIIKLVLSMGDAWVYLMFWSTLALGLACFTKQLSTALIFCFIFWLSVVLIVPQIGDTMDPDNQVPGGLFKALQVDKPHEESVMARFGSYESTRNYLEESSISKHFERAGFAFLGVKDKYDQQPISDIWADTWKGTAWPLAGLVLDSALALSQCNKRKLIERKTK